jgi:hypothetical protein
VRARSRTAREKQAASQTRERRSQNSTANSFDFLSNLSISTTSYRQF